MVSGNDFREIPHRERAYDLIAYAGGRRLNGGLGVPHLYGGVHSEDAGHNKHIDTGQSGRRDKDADG